MAEDQPGLFGRILLLTGPPGAGKTTASRRLAETSPQARAVHLAGDAFFDAIKTGWIAPWTPESDAQNKTVVAAMAAAAAAYARGGYEVVMDAIATGWVLAVFRNLAAAEGLALDYLILLPPEDVAAARAQGRADDPVPDYAPFRGLYAEFEAHGLPDRHVIDSAGLDVEALAAEIRAGLAEGRFRVG